MFMFRGKAWVVGTALRQSLIIFSSVFFFTFFFLLFLLHIDWSVDYHITSYHRRHLSSYSNHEADLPSFLRQPTTTTEQIQNYRTFRDEIMSRSTYYHPHHNNYQEIYEEGMQDKIPFSTNNQSISIDHKKKMIIHHYKKRYHRDPPPNFELWLLFAFKHQIELSDWEQYDQIHLDLLPYRRKGKITHADRMLMESNHFHNQVDKVEIENGKIYKNNGPVHAGSLPALLADSLKVGMETGILPRRLEFYMAWYDFPMSLSKDTDNTVAQETETATVDNDYYVYSNHNNSIIQQHSQQQQKWSFWNKSEDILLHNKCIQQLYTQQTSPIDGMSLGSWHPFFHDNNDIKHTATMQLPFFADCKLPCHGDIVIPRAEYSSSDPVPLTDLIPWAERKKTVYFRGSLSWPFTNSKETWIRHHVRHQLLEWSQWIKKIPYHHNNNNKMMRSYHVDIEVHPVEQFQKDCSDSYLDCRVIKAEASPKTKDDLEMAIEAETEKGETGEKGDQPDLHDNTTTTAAAAASVPSASFVAPKEQYKNKYIITLEGNSFAGRLTRDLASGSLILYGCIYTNWLSTKIKPFVHYIPIPIESSLKSSFTKIMNWIVSNDEIVQEIAEKGHKIGYYQSNQIDMQVYTLLAWIEYASLCEFTEW